MNILFDEIKVQSSLYSCAPRHVSIALTNACDLTCSFCFAPKYFATLDFEIVKKWLLELDNNGCMGVGFGGGEPTLYKDLPNLCEFVQKNTSMAVTLTTHAHRIHKKILPLKGNLNFIRVSMDGIGKTYEILRNCSFNEFCLSLETVRNTAPFGINYVVNSKTFNDLDVALEFAKEMGAVEFLLLPEYPVNGHGGIDIETNKRLKEWIKNNKARIPLSISQNGADGIPICDPFNGETGLDSYAHIDAHGILKKTSFDETGLPINKYGMIEALKLLKSNIVGD